jgi:hypothetical protein
MGKKKVSLCSTIILFREITEFKIYIEKVSTTIKPYLLNSVALSTPTEDCASPYRQLRTLTSMKESFIIITDDEKTTSEETNQKARKISSTQGKEAHGKRRCQVWKLGNQLGHVFPTPSLPSDLQIT